MEKALLRKEMKRLRKKMGIEERKSKDIRIYDNLRTLSKFKENEWFYIYVSYTQFSSCNSGKHTLHGA